MECTRCAPTLLGTNISPENIWLEEEFPFGQAYFQGRTVSFRECTSCKCNNPYKWPKINWGFTGVKYHTYKLELWVGPIVLVLLWFYAT